MCEVATLTSKDVTYYVAEKAISNLHGFQMYYQNALFVFTRAHMFAETYRRTLNTKNKNKI